MKNVFLLICAAGALLLSSCSKMLEPENLERLKPWVFTYVAEGEELGEQFAIKYLLEQYNEDNGFEIVGPEADDLVYALNFAIAGLIMEEELMALRKIADGNYEEYVSFVDKQIRANRYSWWELSEKLEDDWDYSADKARYYSDMALKNPEVYAGNVGRMFGRTFHTSLNKAAEEVEVLEWIMNTDTTGETYTGYLVTYSVGGQYALVDLVEFDKDSRYEAKILTVEDTLSELNEYIAR